MSRRVTLPRPSPWLFDVTLTAVLLVCGLVALYVYTDDSGVVYRDGDGLGVLLVVAVTVPLVFRRRMAPVVALVTAAAVGVGLTAATVQTHVGKLLAKLGVRDRAQAAVYAYESGLVEPGAP
jgi:hypothetical protein